MYLTTSKSQASGFGARTKDIELAFLSGALSSGTLPVPSLCSQFVCIFNLLLPQ